MTERTDTRKAESEALDRLDPVRHPTEAVFATEPEPRKPAKGRAGLFYGVAAVALLVALFILAIGIAALFWLTSGSAESSAIHSEPVAWSTIDETR